MSRPTRVHEGWTLIELVLAAFILVVVAAGWLAAYLGQAALNDQARNLSVALHDATRIIEQLQQQNAGNCAAPSAVLAGGADAWLTAQNPGKSFVGTAQERIVVTCQNQAATQYCNAAQVSAGEWRIQGGAPTHDPLRITVAVCWRSRNRVIGECTWNGAALAPTDGVAGATVGVIESPAMVTTLLTCRG